MIKAIKRFLFGYTRTPLPIERFSYIHVPASLDGVYLP